MTALLKERVLLVYRQRLGDIVGCFPAAERLAALGHEVDFCCLPQYHAIFRTVHYCRPVGLEALKKRAEYSGVYDLEITRAEYDRYRASGQKWRDYVYGKYPELVPAATALPRFKHLPDVSDYRLPVGYALAAPYGISQVTRVNEEWFAEQCRAIWTGPWHVLVDSTNRRCTWATPVSARSLDHLPALIAGAAHFVTINSAPNIIAAGVRSSYHQVYEPGFSGQDNYEVPGQVVLHQPKELARPSWRFQVHHWRRKLLGLEK